MQADIQKLKEEVTRLQREKQVKLRYELLPVYTRNQS